MATGNKSYEGLAVPLFGESNIVADTAGNDILTITGAGSHTGDFLVCRDSDETELAVIDIAGNITGTSLDITGQVEVASIAVTGIGTEDIPLGQAGITTYSVAGLTSNDIVVISPKEAMVGAIVVDQVELSTLTVRNVGSETAAKEFNYLVIGKT
jgi:hypothetical protein